MGAIVDEHGGDEDDELDDEEEGDDPGVAGSPATEKWHPGGVTAMAKGVCEVEAEVIAVDGGALPHRSRDKGTSFRFSLFQLFLRVWIGGKNN